MFTSARRSHLVAALAVIITTMAPASAHAVGSSFTVQSPELKAPGRGSVAGAYADLSFGPGSVSRGSFSLPLPVELPSERGSSLVDFLPRYSPQSGQGAWGMGWSTALEIRREPVVGELDYDAGEFVSPWGRLVAGPAGKWYVQGLQSGVIVTVQGTGWRAVDSAGTLYDFVPGLKNGNKVYSWELVKATDIAGGVTELKWEEIDGQRLLKSVVYGSAIEPALYTVAMTYETTTLAFTSYRSGRAEKIGRRVKTVVVRRGAAERWRYTLTYKESGLSPAYYLVGIQKKYPSGGTEPAITYGYTEADRTLAELYAGPLAQATDRVRAASDVTVFSYDRATHVDANRDGRLDFERASDHALMLRTEDGWVAEPLGPRPDDGYWSYACRPQPNSNNAPRTLARLDGWEGELQVALTVYQGPVLNPNGTVTPGHTKFARCNRDGGLLSVQNIDGHWELSPTVRLVDVNRDAAPDLLKIDTAGFEIVVNPGASQGFGPRYSGRLYLSTGASLNFEPQRLWYEDLNGDGIGDIVTTNGQALYAWYGKGRYQYVDRAVTMSLYRKNGTTWVIDDVGERTVTFVDVNNDGLQDVLLADGAEARLYASWGHVFVFHPTDAFLFGYSRGWQMEQPVLADLDADGDDELVYSGYNLGVEEVRGMQVSPAGTGLLAWVNDGKGSKVSFEYGRGPAHEGVGVRPVVLTALRTRTVGLDADASGTQFGELVYLYDYREPVLHSESRALQGFAGTLRRGPHGVEVVRFHHDDTSVDVVEATITYPLGSAWAGQRTHRMHQFERFEWESTTYAGVPMLRLTKAIAGWGRHPRPDETSPAADSYWSVPEPREELSVQREVLSYEGLCATQVRTTSSKGSLTTDTGLSQISLNGGLHCLAATEVIVGAHPDPTDDFQIAQTVSRNSLGLVTKVWQGSPSSQLLVQSVDYDAYGRVTKLSTPGKSGEVSTTITYAGAMPKAITGPDGVKTEIGSFDQLTDRIRSMSVDRGGTLHQDFFEYDQLERLSKQWDSAGASSQTRPLHRIDYVYPTDASLGRTEASVLVAGPTPGKPDIWRRGVTWHSGDGQEVASGALVREGWAISGLNARSRNQGWQRGYARSPIASTSPALSYAALFDGADELSFAQRDGMGEAMQADLVLAEGVTKKLKVTYEWTPQGITEVSSENGTHVNVVKRDAEGTILWHADPATLMTHFHHDVAGRLRSVSLPDGTEQSVSFDAFGRPARLHRADVGDVAYHYEATSGWLERKDFLDAEGALYRTVTYDYDAVGRLTTTTSTAPDRTPHLVTRYYDGKGPAGTPVVAGQLGRLTRVVGDGFSKEVRLNPDGTEASARLRVGNFIEMESTTTYFADKSPRQVTMVVRNLTTGAVIDQSVRELVYDEFGRLDVLKLNGADLLAVDYDEEGRVRSVGFVTGESVDFSHDSVTRAVNGYTHRTGSLWSSTVKWKVNVHGEVIREDYAFVDEPSGAPSYTGGEVSRGYEYDARGFLRRSTDNGVESGYYEYDNAGMLTFVRDEEGARTIGHPRDRRQTVGGVDYVYDAAGRLIEKGALRYAYGAHGDIAEVSGPDGVFRYYYDEFGQRILKTKVAGGVETPHAAFVDGDYITADKRIEPFSLAGRLMGVLENGQFRMLATDPRGSTVADLDGTINMPSAYGVRAERPDLSEALDFAEKGYDAELQLVRMGVRDYDPALGQFTRPDPLFVESIDACAASAVECNLFGYALNNPVSFVDPSGTSGEDHLTLPTEAATYRDSEGTTTHVFFGDEGEGAEGGTGSSGTGPMVGLEGNVTGGGGTNDLPYTGLGNGEPYAGSEGPIDEEAMSLLNGRPDGSNKGDPTWGRPGGVEDGATNGKAGGAAQVPIIKGWGLFGSFSDFVTSLLPKVSGSTAQAIDGASILLTMVSGAAGPALRVAKAALSKASGKLKSAFKWIRCRNSFAAGTLVMTMAGLLPIEEVEAGDLVWSRDEVTGVEDWRPTTGTIVGHSEVLELTTRGSNGTEVIVVTANHPMAAVGRGWVNAGDLTLGDRMQSAEGNELVVAGLRSLPAAMPVFNFEVAEFHTYFVGDDGVWAHNCPKGGGGGSVELRYEHNDKHRSKAYKDSRGKTVSREPRGDCQGMLDCSVYSKEKERLGVEPSTGLQVVFKKHLEQQIGDKIVQFFHGFVPE